MVGEALLLLHTACRPWAVQQQRQPLQNLHMVEARFEEMANLRAGRLFWLMATLQGSQILVLVTNGKAPGWCNNRLEDLP